MTFAAWSELNTILAIPLKEVVRQTHKKLQGLFPNFHVGKVGDGSHDISSQLTVTTFKSLDICATEKCQMLLVDEMQSAAGAKFLETVLQMTPRRIFGYTATDNGLFTGADKVLKGLFGERLIHIPYQEAQDVNAVVPCKVFMVRTDRNFILSGTSLDYKFNHGIKTCVHRNQLVGQICAKAPAQWQVIVFIDHVQDHLPALYKFMPAGTRFLHRESSKKAAGGFALTPKQQTTNVDDFVNNEYQYLIATDAFRAGVDIPNCRVVIQVAGGSSKIEVLQEAYRGSRILTQEYQDRLKVGPKTHFVLIDFTDEHDETLRRMAEKRESYYRQEGWEITTVDHPDQIKWEIENADK